MIERRCIEERKRPCSLTVDGDQVTGVDGGMVGATGDVTAPLGLHTVVDIKRGRAVDGQCGPGAAGGGREARLTVTVITYDCLPLGPGSRRPDDTD